MQKYFERRIPAAKKYFIEILTFHIIALLMMVFSSRKLRSEDSLKPGRQTFGIRLEGRERRYHVHVPSSYDSKKSMPVVLIFHGAGGNGTGCLDKNGWAAKAESEGFLAVAPDGVPPRPNLPANFFLNPRLWNDGQLRPESARSKIDDTAFVRALLEDLRRRGPIDDRRIYATGHSNGAGMTFRLAAELSDNLAAIAPVAGQCWVQDPKPAHPLPTLYIIGTKDPLVKLEGGEIRTPWGQKINPPVEETLKKWARGLGIAAAPSVIQETNGVKIVRYGPESGAVSLTVLYIEGQGHGWPGGRESGLPERWIGPNTESVKATDIIWDFFKSRRKN